VNPTIVIPVKNRLDLTAPLVDELVRQGGYRQLRVYDNGSTDGTMDWLLSRTPDVWVMDVAEWTLHKMWNDGIESSGGGPVVFLNNDIVLDGKPDWIRRLCSPLAYRWAATCPNYDGRTTVSPVQRLRGISAGRTDGTGGLSGFAFAVRGDVLTTYRFPESMKWWCGDRDLVAHLHINGLPYGMVADVGVTHIGGGSQTVKAEGAEKHLEDDRAAFSEKWEARLGVTYDLSEGDKQRLVKSWK
jgi:GT2 family glycosyltransferase